MKNNLIRILAFATMALALPANAPAQSDNAMKPKILGVLFYADWCGSCKVLEPKLDAIKGDFAGRRVLFTRVDFTDDFTKEQSDLLASYLDLGPTYTEQGRKTGFMLLIDPATKRVLGKLVKTQSEAELKVEIENALGA